ncbi:hypothetical protein [Vibrio cholerae]|uniref:hypothetical protein n=1 Tax=Vibrio cholerae TaxID=666 RepID=UPI003530EF86
MPIELTVLAVGSALALSGWFIQRMVADHDKRLDKLENDTAAQRTQQAVDEERWSRNEEIKLKVEIIDKGQAVLTNRVDTHNVNIVEMRDELKTMNGKIDQVLERLSR